MKDFRNVSLSVDERVEALLAQLTPEEKLSQLNYRGAGIPRLGIAPYVWWNEALHGLARSGSATVFPQAIAMAATFCPATVGRMAEIVALEGRARHHESLRQGDHGTYKGLTFWSPNINIFRDPRWGRGHETYGEDPLLTGTLGAAYVRGLQGDDPDRMKACATPKHFAVHSGPEANRLSFNSVVSEQDLRETYLPAFKMCVEAGARSVMSAYNAINGEPCSSNRRLLVDILRGEWGFEGAVVTDAGAVDALRAEHKTCTDYPEAAARALLNGVDVLTDWARGENQVLARGLMTVEQVDHALRNQLRVKFRLGLFDPPQTVPLSDTPLEVIECPAHREAALDAARKSVVLLRNRGGLLPLDRKKIRSLAVIGPNADLRDILLGNYHGTPTRHVTPLEGLLAAVEPGCRVWHARGCEHLSLRTEACAEDYDRIAEAVSVAQRSDAVVMFMGLTPRIEGEAGDAFNSEAAGDKTFLELPGLQNLLIEKVCATGKPVVLVLISGSALAPTWADGHVPAILQGWYPGAEGGRALAEILFGEVNPSGRLPLTFYRRLEDLPPFTDYAMAGRTYRFFQGEPLYPFGYGLSYTRFEYRDLKVAAGANGSFTATVTVANTGGRDGEEVVQAYVSDVEASHRTPLRQLAAFQRVTLRAGESRTIALEIGRDRLLVTAPDGSRFVEPGLFRLFVGGSQPDARSIQLTGQHPLEATFEISA